ncbi:hypothetical protein ACLKA6_003197 [Drosophila palustris]
MHLMRRGALSDFVCRLQKNACGSQIGSSQKQPNMCAVSQKAQRILLDEKVLHRKRLQRKAQFPSPRGPGSTNNERSSQPS